LHYSDSFLLLHPDAWDQFEPQPSGLLCDLLILPSCGLDKHLEQKWATRLGLSVGLLEKFPDQE